MDGRTVDEFVDTVVEKAGRVDVSFNLISYEDVQEPLLEISVEDFLRPIATATRTQFLTTRAAARHMVGELHGDGPSTLGPPPGG